MPILDTGGAGWERSVPASSNPQLGGPVPKDLFLSVLPSPTTSHTHHHLLRARSAFGFHRPQPAGSPHHLSHHHSPCWLLWYTPELLNPGPTGELPRGSKSPKILHPVLYLGVSVSGGETLTCTMLPKESMTPNRWSTTIPGLYFWTLF